MFFTYIFFNFFRNLEESRRGSRKGSRRGGGGGGVQVLSTLLPGPVVRKPIKLILG